MVRGETRRIDINRPPGEVYDYVTRPWAWHEWHPASRSAENAGRKLSVGDTFREIIELQPLSPLPLRMRRETEYRVVEAVRPSAWEVHGDTGDGWLRIRYELCAIGDATTFTRKLTFGARGLSRLLMPLLKRRISAQSELALANLKTRLEQGQGSTEDG